MSVSPVNLADPTWRKSSFSGSDGTVRNSKHRDAGVVFFTRAEMAAYLAGAKAAEFDDLA